MFSGENCPKFISCDFAENDCWYVAFDNEDEAQEVCVCLCLCVCVDSTHPLSS